MKKKEKEIIINEKKYEIIENDRDCLDIEELLEKATDYFYDYDYKVRDVLNEICKERNISRLENYCFECKRWGFDTKTVYTMPNPLEIVIANYWDEGFDYIVENYPQYINLAQYYGKYDEYTSLPIIIAVQNDNLYALRKLLQLGADVNVFPLR